MVAGEPLPPPSCAGCARGRARRRADRPGPGVPACRPTGLRIAIHEGRNRQVRRMCEAVGHPVERLVRIPHRARSPTAGCAPGQWRALTPGEVRSLEHGRGRRSARAPPAAAGRRRPSRPRRRPAPPGRRGATGPGTRGQVARPGRSRVGSPLVPAAVRALRGATTVDEDTAEPITERVQYAGRGDARAQRGGQGRPDQHRLHRHRRHPRHVPGAGRPRPRTGRRAAALRTGARHRRGDASSASGSSCT